MRTDVITFKMLKICATCADPEGDGDRGSGPPPNGKLQKYRVS